MFRTLKLRWEAYMCKAGCASVRHLHSVPSEAARRHSLMLGSTQQFLSRLRVRETGLDLDSFAWYCDHYDCGVVYGPAVSAPGRVIRNPETGLPAIVQMTVREYFMALGVDALFDPGQPDCLIPMQYAATNALGFIGGYQFGEALLAQYGFYEPERVAVGGIGASCPRFYCGDLDGTHWRGGCREQVHRNRWTGMMTVMTDVNLWRGRFTGLEGVDSLDALKTEEVQERLIRIVLRGYGRELLSGFGRGATPYHLCHALYEAYPDVRRPGLPPLSALSGLLAAAHLGGVNAVLALLNGRGSREDEFGTSMLSYINEFQGFDVRGMWAG